MNSAVLTYVAARGHSRPLTSLDAGPASLDDYSDQQGRWVTKDHEDSLTLGIKGGQGSSIPFLFFAQNQTIHPRLPGDKGPLVY